MNSRAAKDAAYNLIKKGKYAVSEIGKAAKEVSWNVTAPIKGLMADIERGHVLHGQGFGKKRDSALKIAKRGRSNKDRH